MGGSDDGVMGVALLNVCYLSMESRDRLQQMESSMSMVISFAQVKSPMTWSPLVSGLSTALHAADTWEYRLSRKHSRYCFTNNALRSYIVQAG